MSIDVSQIAIANSKSKARVDYSQMYYTLVFMAYLTLSYVTLYLYFVTGR
jgi:hypothetical protein